MIQTIHEGSSEQVDKEQNHHSAASIGSSQRPFAQDSSEHTGTSTGDAWGFIRTPNFQSLAQAGQSTAGGNGDSERTSQDNPDPSRNLESTAFMQPIDQDLLERLGFTRSDRK